MADIPKTVPDFFEETPVDPISSAIGPTQKSPSPKSRAKSLEIKRKAGFYLTETVLDRFNRTFYQLKLEGLPVENKSALLEMALRFALDDLDKGADSRLRNHL